MNEKYTGSIVCPHCGELHNVTHSKKFDRGDNLFVCSQGMDDGGHRGCHEMSVVRCILIPISIAKVGKSEN